MQRDLLLPGEERVDFVSEKWVLVLVCTVLTAKSVVALNVSITIAIEHLFEVLWRVINLLWVPKPWETSKHRNWSKQPLFPIWTALSRCGGGVKFEASDTLPSSHPREFEFPNMKLQTILYAPGGGKINPLFPQAAFRGLISLQQLQKLRSQVLLETNAGC